MGGGFSPLFPRAKRIQPEVIIPGGQTSRLDKGDSQNSAKQIINGDTLASPMTKAQSITVEKKKCQCCGEFSLDFESKYEVCSNCGWCDDPEQNANPTLKNKSNKMSLEEAKVAYSQKQKIY